MTERNKGVDFYNRLSEATSEGVDVGYRWFKEQDLLKDLMIRHDGDINAAIASTPGEIERAKYESGPLNTAEILGNPAFWHNFYEDIESTGKDAYNVHHFMMYINPGTNEKSAAGKYRGIYDGLIHEIMSTNAIANDPRVVDAQYGQFSHRVAARDYLTDLLYSSAPALVKESLVEIFPDDFSEHKPGLKESVESALNEWEAKGVLPGSIRPLISRSSVMTPERQVKMVRALADYTAQKLQDPFLDAPKLEKFYLKRLKENAMLQANLYQGETDIVDLINEFQHLPYLIEEAVDNDMEQPEELLDVVEEEVLLPALVSALYKPASLFWNEYFEEGGERKNVAEALDAFLSHYLGSEFMGEQDEQDMSKVSQKYFNEWLFPKIRAHFFDITKIYADIEFFRHNSGTESPAYLYLHQVEGIKELMRNDGGILADEPGTGKTLILALSALNSIERESEVTNAQGRVLIVANKTVINNWEEEMKIHLRTDRFDVVNLNSPPSPNYDGQRLDADTVLPKRLKAFEHALAEGRDKKQLCMVHYDIFRNPRFKKLLEEYGFDVLIVDEVHNVKSRDIEIVERLQNDMDKEKGSEARRTRGLYQFIYQNPDMRVYFASATPYVKELAEPLVMANLINPDRFDHKSILNLAESNEGSYTALRSIMIRRRKKEVADLPEKTTRFVPIGLDGLETSDQEMFKETAAELLNKAGQNGFARFYSVWALESQAKMGWLTEEAAKLTKNGRKVVIFTPFVTESGKYTSPMSTMSIANKLKESGVKNVGILDGSLDLRERSRRQEQFRLPSSEERGLDVIVGNYQTAGESITLCSPDNNATEVILFVCPNTVANLVQAVDRIHRFGQIRDVTIHVPFVTNDILSRSEGTYDERIVSQLYRELAQFEQVIDGLFFVEPVDLYQDIVQRERVSAALDMDPQEILRQVSEKPVLESEWEIEAVVRHRQEQSLLAGYEFGDDMHNVDGDIDYSMVSDASDPDVKFYFQEMARYKLLTHEEEIELFKKIEGGEQAFDVLEKYPDLDPDMRADILHKVHDAKLAREVLINSNQRLVTWVAAKHNGRGLDFLDLIQEGNLGLMKALDKYDVHKINTKNGRPYKLSTYATWWVRQSITRAIENQSSTIRIPVYRQQKTRELAKVAGSAGVDLSQNPDVFALAELMETTPEDIEGILTDISIQPASLDMTTGEDGDPSLFDFVPDPNQNVEDEVIAGYDSKELRKRVHKVMNDLLDGREIDILRRRSQQTLEEVGAKHGITRERVRQIQAKAEKRLKSSPQLVNIWRHYYKGELVPSFSIEGRDPERILSGEDKEPIGRIEPLEEAIFTLPRFQARVAYRKLYLRLPDEQIAHEFDDVPVARVNMLFARARLKLWETLPMAGHKSSEYLKDRLRYFPQLNPAYMEELFRVYGDKLSDKDRDIVTNYFGFSNSSGLFSTREVAKRVKLSPKETRRRFLESLRTIEEEIEKVDKSIS